MAAAVSASYSAASVALRSPAPLVSMTRLPSSSSRSDRSGQASASSDTSRTITPFSVAGCLRKRSLAGVLKKSRLTVSRVPGGDPATPDSSTAPACRSTRWPASRPAARLTASTSATAAMLARASPRKPSVLTARMSSRRLILLVAWRWNATDRSSGKMPEPSSTTSTRPRPASCTRTVIRCAPASIAFSTSSLTTAAGRSTTSPAAIASATEAGRTAIREAGSTSAGGMFHLPGEELVQGLARGEPFEVELLELLDQGVLERKRELRALGRTLQRSLALELAQDLAGANYHLTGQAGQLRHVDAVAAVGPAGHHFVEKNHTLPFLPDLHPIVAQPRQSLGQCGQLVVMGGEQGEALQLRGLVDVLEDGLGYPGAPVGPTPPPPRPRRARPEHQARPAPWPSRAAPRHSESRARRAA